MMNREEFNARIQENILNFLPEKYSEAEVSLSRQVKQNDIEQTGLAVRLPDENGCPIIYLDSFYEAYRNGQSLDGIMETIAKVRSDAIPSRALGIDVAFFSDYQNVRSKLTMCAYDTEKNQRRLEEVVHHSFGDYSCAYSIILRQDRESQMRVMVTPSMMEMWGITKRQLHEDAIMADISRGLVFTTIMDMMSSLGADHPNLLEGENAHMTKEQEDYPLFCLTSKTVQNGAGLILNPVVQEQIASFFDGNYFVLPSSVHEILVIPDNGTYSARELEDMVKSINETVVDPKDVLSDKVAYYDRSERKLVNAAEHEKNMQVQPEMKKAAVK